MHTISYKKANTILAMVTSLLICLPAFAQSNGSSDEYRPLKRLGGTNQSICRPAIQSAQELQSFAKNQRQDLLDILGDAEWQGDPELLFGAIARGEFSENIYPVGTRLEWMGMREQGKPTASRKRSWEGEQSFEAFELNIASSCTSYQFIIPKACCNVSLVQSSPIKTDVPNITVNQEQQATTITVSGSAGAQAAKLTYPDGHSEQLTLENGRWTGSLAPGSYQVEATQSDDCGTSVPAVYRFDANAPAAAPMATMPGGLFLAPFIGRQVRNIDPPLLGIQVGWSNPINEKTDWFIQGGGSYNLDADELSLFVDLGIERKFGDKGGFFGGGIGAWDINNSDDLPNSTSPKTDLSYFIQGGANTPWQFHERPVQWFAEARIFDDFTDDISNHNVLKLGLRYWY